MFHYAADDFSQTRAARAGRDRRPWAAFVAILAAALALRFGLFRDPITGLDEQLYLLVGERLWAGDWPYVDIWDRKPLGLFLLFAGIARLPLDHVLAAQLVATGFAAATGCLVALIARRGVGWAPATMAGVFYLADLNELWGETTQSPVFYNALIAAAALLTLRTTDRPGSSRRPALAAMALAGLAIQIKTNAVFEGGWFGLWLVWHEWRTTRSRRATVRFAGAAMLVAAIPTLLASAGYAAAGHGAAWWQANVQSILARGASTDPAAMKKLVETSVLFAPCGLLALLGLRSATGRFTRLPREAAFLVGWVLISVVDAVVLGGFYPHYALPLMLACCPLVARTFALRRVGPVLFVLSLAWPLYHATVLNPVIARTERGYAAQVVATVPPAVQRRCLFIYEGPVAYYSLTHACRVTRFAFSAHLGSRREAGALGVDPVAEIGQLGARRPLAIMTVEHSVRGDHNPAADAAMRRLLAAHYRLAARLPHRFYSPEERLLLWRLVG